MANLLEKERIILRALCSFRREVTIADICNRCEPRMYTSQASPYMQSLCRKGFAQSPRKYSGLYAATPLGHATITEQDPTHERD